MTVERYLEHNPGAAEEYTAAELEKVIEAAELVVENASSGRTRELDSFPADVREKVIKAICAQTDFILNNFGADMAEAIPESASVGSFSYSTGGSGKDISPATLNHIAKLYLSSAGLLYRGGICVVY